MTAKRSASLASWIEQFTYGLGKQPELEVKRGRRHSRTARVMMRPARRFKVDAPDARL